MKCFRLRCYVNNSFLVFHQGQGSHFWGNFPKTGKLADFWGAIWGIAFFGEIFGEFFEILVKLDGSTWNLCFNCFCLVLCTFGSTSFSYPEPYLRAVRRGALAKSKTGNHKNMVRYIYVIRTITFVVANQMPV